MVQGFTHTHGWQLTFTILQFSHIECDINQWMDLFWLCHALLFISQRNEMRKKNVWKISTEIDSRFCALPLDVLQLTTPNHPPFSLPSRVSTMKPHSMTAQNMRDSSGPNHLDSRSFCTATELPNVLQWLLLLLLLFVRWWFDVHHLIWPMTVLARERGFWSICQVDCSPPFFIY